MKIATRIGKPRHLRGLLFGAVGGLVGMVGSLVLLPPSAAVAGLVFGLVAFWLGYRVGGVVPEKLAAHQALKLAQEDAPNFVVGRQLLGVNNASGMLLDAKHGQFMVFEEHGNRCSVLPYAALMQCEIVEDGHAVSVMTTNRGSQLLGAAVGAVAFGGVGAVVGALTGSKTSKGGAMLSELALRLTVEDEVTPTFRVVLFKVDKPIAKQSKVAKEAVRSAEDASALIAIIMRKAAARGQENRGATGRPGGQDSQLARTQPMELS